jgi:hypothetical protein
MWTTVDFGSWRDKGKTLPQIITSDPDWFFWANEKSAFKGKLQQEADILARRATSMKLPQSVASTHCIQYVFTRDGKFESFKFIPKNQTPHVGSSPEQLSSTLSLAITRSFRNYDKSGAKILLAGFKKHWFSGKRFRKELVEEFFDDPANFENP